MYIPTVHDKFFALKIEIQYNCSTFNRPRGKSKRILVHRIPIHAEFEYFGVFTRQF